MPASSGLDTYGYQYPKDTDTVFLFLSWKIGTQFLLFRASLATGMEEAKTMYLTSALGK